MVITDFIIAKKQKNLDFFNQRGFHFTNCSITTKKTPVRKSATYPMQILGKSLLFNSSKGSCEAEDLQKIFKTNYPSKAS